MCERYERLPGRLDQVWGKPIKMMRKLILLPLFVTLLLLASPFLAKGQGSGGWDVFTPAEGLVSDDVRVIAEDGEGRLWLGTAHGAYRYDGHAFTPCPDLDNRQVDAILLDREGRLWFGTEDGVYYQPPAGLAIQEVPISDFTYSIAQDQDGALWFGTLYGVYRYEGQGEPEQYLKQYTVRAVWWDDQRHSLWIGTEAGVIRYDGQDFTNVPLAETGGVWAIGQDHRGDLWVGTDHGVYRYDEARQAIVKAFTPEDGPLYDERVVTIFKDAESRLWFGTVEGVSSYDGQEVIPLAVPVGLVGKYVQTIWQDGKEGCLWFGTTGGLGRFKGHFWQNYTTEHGLPSNQVRAIWRGERGDLWIGTDNGACSFDGNRFAPYLTGRAVLAIGQEREGALWFGASDGAYRYDGCRFEKPPELVGKEVRAIAQDAAGALWFATNQGVCRLDEGGLVSFTVEDGLVSNNVNTILLDSSSILWVGTPSGVSRYEEGCFEGFDLSSYGGHDIPNVLAIQEDSHSDIWFGTNRGAIRYRRQERAFDQPYLAERHIHAIFQDGLGNLWLGTDGGTYARPNGEEGVWEESAFTTDDGLAHDTVLSIWWDDEGDLWFGTLGGLSRYRPSREPPWVRIQLYVGDEKDPRQPSEEGIILDHDENNVRIELVGGDFRTHPQDLRYRYKLEGWDESEVLTSNAFAPYPLRYRKVWGDTHYRFQVRAVDADLNFSSPASLPITVRPQPLWTLPELYVLVAVAALAYPVLRRFSKEHRYSDLEVVVGRGEGAFELVVSASNPRPKVWAAVGKALRGLGVRPPDLFAPRREIVPSPLRTSLPGDEMSSMVKRLQDGEVDGRFLQYLGGRLFDAIFVDEIREHLLKRTRWRRSVRLRLCFQEDASGLASLPWEYMYGGERLGFLGASPQVAVTRYRPPEEAVERSRTTRPLRILAVIANPRDLAEKGLKPIAVQEEKESLEVVWRELNTKGQVVEWKFHEEATMEALHSELGKEGYDIVHFIAHGDFQEDSGGLLYLKDKEGRGLRIFEEELSGLFRAYHAQSKRPPALVVLNTCRSAASAEKGALAGLAPTLLREGKLLAAVGMQSPIGDEPAKKFAARFYEALLRNGQVDYAVSMARNAIAADLGFDIHDWGIPVLYMQTTDGIIFELA